MCVREIVTCLNTLRHHGVYIRPWFGHHGPLTRYAKLRVAHALEIPGGGENVPGIPGACAPAIWHIWQEAQCLGSWLGTWTNANILSIDSSGTNINEIRIKIQVFPSYIIHLVMSSAKYRLLCSNLNVLTWCPYVSPWGHSAPWTWPHITAVPLVGR